MNTLASVLLREGRCSACQRPPEHVEQVVHFDTHDIDIVFWCHGRRQVTTIPADVIEYNSHHAIGRALDESRALFPEDGYPDMIELLRYSHAYPHDAIDRFTWKRDPFLALLWRRRVT